MEIENVRFKLLNYDIRERKENKGEFISLNVIDVENNPCSFLIFNKDIIEFIKSHELHGLQDLTLSLKLVYSNNLWNVRVTNIIL